MNSNTFREIALHHIEKVRLTSTEPERIEWEEDGFKWAMVKDTWFEQCIEIRISCSNYHTAKNKAAMKMFMCFVYPKDFTHPTNKGNGRYDRRAEYKKSGFVVGRVVRGMTV